MSYGDMFAHATAPYPEGVLTRAESFLMFAGARVRRSREKLGLTQQQLADKTGHGSPRAIQRIEAGLTDMSITSIVRLADFLEIPPSSLLRPTRPLKRRAGRPKNRKSPVARP
jgi:transcriptional regulator with XRE-family HTH domain